MNSSKINRVKEYGEVFTKKEIAKDILNLVNDETYNIESRILETACGEGVFLLESLKRKFDINLKRYKKNQIEFEKNSIIIFGSLYGIDIQEKNVLITREKMYEFFYHLYFLNFNKKINQKLLKSINFILKMNIINGDALTLKNHKNKNLTFYEWSFFNNFVKIRLFEFQELLANQSIDGPNLFSDLGENAFIPKPKKEYDKVHYLNLYNVK